MDRKNLASRAAHWAATHRKTAIFGWLAFVVAGFMIGQAVGQNEIHGADQFSGESGRAEKALFDSGLRPNTENVLIQSETLTVDDAEFKQTIEQTSDRLARTKDVENVVSPLNGGGTISEDGHSALVEFEITGDDLEAQDRIDPAETTVKSVAKDHPDLDVEQFGTVSSNKELNDTFASDLAKAELLSLPLTLLILLVAFGTFVAALVPLLIGVTCVMAAESLVAIPSQLSPVDGNLASVILLVGLAVGVDYSLFYIRREREERAAGRDARSALQVAAATSGRAVMISGLTVIAAMAGMLFTGDKTFISFAEGTMLVVAIAIFASLTVLPAVLAWLGDRIDKGKIPFISRRRAEAGESRFWSRFVDRVMRRPWFSIALAGGFLVALAIPALSMRIVQTSTDDLPQDLAVIKTYNKLREAFPTEGVTVDVAVEATNVRDLQNAAGIRLLQRRAPSTEGVIGPADVTYSENGKVALIEVPTAGNGNDDESNAALKRIRDELIPATVGGIDGTTVNVSGNAASSQDFSDVVNSRLPLIFLFVFTLAFILMLFTFRSIVIPIKAILLNLLSVGAAYGILVLIFQNGNLEGLLGFNSNGGVTSWLPLFLFVLLFGLSMDYHIFILSRVRELVDSGKSTPEAVRLGIASTAGTVTSAAAVMVFVFGVFATLSFLDFKEMGIGLAAAVLIDATIIRAVLLPASMSVLGEWNWYLPSWLEWLPHVEGESGPPTPIVTKPSVT
jgi:RND superfamily putative drug exporter